MYGLPYYKRGIRVMYSEVTPYNNTLYAQILQKSTFCTFSMPPVACHVFISILSIINARENKMAYFLFLFLFLQCINYFNMRKQIILQID